MWCNCITVKQMHHIGLRTTVHEGSLVNEKQTSRVSRSFRPLWSSWSLLWLIFEFFQIFGSALEVLTLWARSYVALFPDLTTTRWSFFFFLFIRLTLNHFSSNLQKNNRILEIPLRYNNKGGYESRSRGDNWTHGWCSFLRSIRYECNHTHICLRRISHTHPSADRANSSMGSLWKKEKRSHQRLWMVLMWTRAGKNCIKTGKEIRAGSGVVSIFDLALLPAQWLSSITKTSVTAQNWISTSVFLYRMSFSRTWIPRLTLHDPVFMTKTHRHCMSCFCLNGSVSKWVIVY